MTLQSSGETLSCSHGTKIIGVPGVVHREESEGYTAILGLPFDPSALSRPINKAPLSEGS